MRKLYVFLYAASFALLTIAASSQEKPPAPQGGTMSTGTVTVQTKVEAGVTGGVVGAIVSSGPGWTGVRGMPFSAETIDENDQLLGDGTRIHRETHGKIFRDFEGRTRSESEFGSFGAARPFVSISIFDPVAETMIVLDPEQKKAQVHHFGEAMKAIQRPAQGTAKVAGGSAAKPAGGVITSGNLRDAHSSHEDLGTKDIDGFTARGMRDSFTIPAGAIGNDKPITTVTERWYSEDLGTELIIKSENPQSGTNVHRLVNIQSGDPDPLLFQVPADYTVEERKQH